MSIKTLHTYIESTDIGDTVQCDVCGEEYPSTNKTSGGFLFSSYAYCPKCAPEALKRIKEYREDRYIREYCPTGMSFHNWVMKLRGGDNTVKIITKEPERK